MLRVLHIVGALNNWALHQRALALVRALAKDVSGTVVSYKSLRPSSLQGVDFVHIHGLQLVSLAWKNLGKITCRWGFEVVSERSFAHLKRVPNHERSHVKSPLVTSGLLKKAHCCWVKNPRLGEKILPYVTCKPVYVPNGVDPTIFRPRAIVVGWVGNKRPAVREYKGLPLILGAVKKLNATLPCGCVFLEDPSNYPHVVPQKQLVEYYRKLDVFVSASIGEGSSNVVNEALACGVPVVSTDTGMARELWQDELPIIIVDRAVDAIAKGIVTVTNLKNESYDIMRRQYAWGGPRIASIYLRGYAKQ